MLIWHCLFCHLSHKWRIDALGATRTLFLNLCKHQLFELFLPLSSSSSAFQAILLQRTFEIYPCCTYVLEICGSKCVFIWSRILGWSGEVRNPSLLTSTASSKNKTTFAHSRSMVSVKTLKGGPRYCMFLFSWQIFPMRDRVGRCQAPAEAQPLKSEKESLKKVLFFGLWCCRALQRIYARYQETLT